MNKYIKSICFVLTFMILLGSGFTTYANDIEKNLEVNTEKTHLYQEVDADGNIVVSKEITDEEYELMKVQQLRSQYFIKTKYLCGIKLDFWYNRVINAGIPFFVLGTTKYVFTPNPSDLWHYNIVQREREMSGTIFVNNQTDSYYFTP